MAPDYGIEIVAAEAFTSDAKTDFSVQIQKVQESGAELLFLPIYYQEAALILTQAQKVNLDVKYFGADGLDGIIDQLGADVAVAENVMLMSPFSAFSEDEKSANFTNAYKAAYNNEVPNQFAADAYDAVYAVKEAMENIDDISQEFAFCKTYESPAGLKEFIRKFLDGTSCSVVTNA